VQETRRIGRTAAARDALYISIVLGKAQGKNYKEINKSSHNATKELK